MSPAEQIKTVGENDVIVIYDRDSLLGHRQFDSLAAALHERFPGSLVIHLPGDSEFETMTEGELRSLLEALIDHQKHRVDRA